MNLNILNSAVNRGQENSSYHSIFNKHKNVNSHSRSFKNNKNFSGRIDSSINKGPILMKLNKTNKKFQKRNKSKTQYSSCSFRNSQGLNTNGLTKRRPSSTLQPDIPRKRFRKPSKTKSISNKSTEFVTKSGRNNFGFSSRKDKVLTAKDENIVVMPSTKNRSIDYNNSR